MPSLKGVRVFPLPNVVLFPRAVLPLHIFEPRYRAMIRDALASDKQLAMALPLAGWEKNYHGRNAIHDVVCVGTILSHEQLEDGRYNLLLQGHTRARIVTETTEPLDVYRTLDLEPLVETNALEIDLLAEREKLGKWFNDAKLSDLDIIKPFREFLASAMPTRDAADLIAFTFLEDAAEKQSLLEELNVVHRVRKILSSLDKVKPALLLAAAQSRGQANMN